MAEQNISMGATSISAPVARAPRRRALRILTRAARLFWVQGRALVGYWTFPPPRRVAGSPRILLEGRRVTRVGGNLTSRAWRATGRVVGPSGRADSQPASCVRMGGVAASQRALLAWTPSPYEPGEPATRLCRLPTVPPVPPPGHPLVPLAEGERKEEGWLVVLPCASSTVACSLVAADPEYVEYFEQPERNCGIHPPPAAASPGWPDRTGLGWAGRSASY